MLRTDGVGARVSAGNCEPQWHVSSVWSLTLWASCFFYRFAPPIKKRKCFGAFLRRSSVGATERLSARGPHVCGRAWLARPARPGRRMVETRERDRQTHRIQDHFDARKLRINIARMAQGAFGEAKIRSHYDPKAVRCPSVNDLSEPTNAPPLPNFVR